MVCVCTALLERDEPTDFQAPERPGEHDATVVQLWSCAVGRPELRSPRQCTRNRGVVRFWDRVSGDSVSGLRSTDKVYVDVRRK